MSHIGLLQKANLLTQNRKLAFLEFIFKHNTNFCAILTESNGTFLIKNSIGFDSVSICNSCSSKDFWNGLLPETDKEYFFSTENKNLNEILQFFSFKLKDVIESVSIFKTENFIFMLCNKILSTEGINDLKFLDYNSEFRFKYNLDALQITSDNILSYYNFDFSEAIESSVLQNIKPNNVNYSLYKDAVQNEISNRMFCIFQSPHFIKKCENKSLNVVLNTKTKICADFFYRHILSSISTIIDNNSSLINISENDTCKTLSQLKDVIF